MVKPLKELLRRISLDPAHLLQPKEIVEELQRHLKESRMELPFRVVIPGHYYIYLHPADYKRIRPWTPLLVEDAVKSMLAYAQEKNYQLVTPSLEIALYEDLEKEVAEGEVLVQSECLLPSPGEADMEGCKTVRVTRSTTPQQVEVHSQATGTQSLAEFQHEENGRPLVYTMTKPKILIGRRTSRQSPDLALASTRAISRRHVEVTYETPGKFFIEDLHSTFGTTINGQKIAAGARVELPPDARIGLADAVFLRFTPKV